MDSRKNLETVDDDELLIAENLYSANCLIGNWSNDKMLEKEQIHEYLERRKRGELLSQKTSRLFDNLLAEVQLTPSDAFIAFDQFVQVVSCDSSLSQQSQPFVLSLVVNEANINRCQQIDESSYVTCAPSIKPFVRNSFIIRRPPKRNNKIYNNVNKQTDNTDDKYLKYGQEFYLECFDSKHKPQPLLLYSSPKSPLDQNPNYTFKANGEAKQSIGLSLQQLQQQHANSTYGHYDECNNNVSSAYCLWCCYHINPEIRYETMGDYIPTNAKVIIQHTFSGRNLCLEKELVRTIFGMEYGVTCHTMKDKYSVEKSENIWQLSSKSTDIM